MINFPNIKINIGLNVIKKRTDGYHNIESVFYPVKSYCDCIEIIHAEKFDFQIIGEKIPGRKNNNLIYRAYHLLKKRYHIPEVKIVLLKNIPTGAGLGGGSSDGTFTLKLLNDLFTLNLSNPELHELSLELGSDCPFFLDNRPFIVRGRGEILEPINLNLQKYFITIITPPYLISTAEAYSYITPTKPDFNLKDIIDLPIEEWQKHIINDFECYIGNKFPEIIGIKQQLYSKGAFFASVSGSGSSVFGLSETEINKDGFPVNYKIWQGKMGSA